MLVDIVANFLSFTELQAKSLLELLVLEKTQNQQIKPVLDKLRNDNMLVEAEIITSLQDLAQRVWFKGHDRSKLLGTYLTEDVLTQYYKIFTALGLTQAIRCNSQVLPHFSIILGSTASQIYTRLATLKRDLLTGLIPTEQIIFGLGCNRQLGVSANESEAEGKKRLVALRLPPTEMNLMNLAMTDLLSELSAKNSLFSKLNYYPILTTSASTSRQDENCVKTMDTASSLKVLLEKEFHHIKPACLIVYSQQPYIERQQRDMQFKLSDYEIIATGEEMSEDVFKRNPKSLAICLGEVARLVNIAYLKADLVSLRNKKLTYEEQQEFKTL